MSAKKKTLEQEISTLVADAEALRERADELLDRFAESRRPSGVPAGALRRMWENKSLTHDPILALSFALQEAGNS